MNGPELGLQGWRGEQEGRVCSLQQKNTDRLVLNPWLADKKKRVFPFLHVIIPQVFEVERSVRYCAASLLLL